MDERSHLLINKEEDISDAWLLGSQKKVPWLKKKVIGRMPRWLLILLIFLILMTVTFVITWIVILPVIVQKVVDGSNLSFTEIHMRSPTSNSFRIDAKGVLKDAGPLSATITAPSADPNAGSQSPNILASPPQGSVTIHYENVPMAYMFLPKTTTKGGADLNDLVIKDTVVGITNKTQWTQFGKDLIVKSSLLWHLEGLVDLEALGRTYKNVKFSKDVTVPGFSGLKNVTVQKFDLQSSNSTNIIAKMTVAISQDSIVNIGDMGDLQMDLFYQNVTIGTVYAKNTTLGTGVTLMEASGSIDSPRKDLLSDLMSRYLGTTDTPVTAVITASSNDLLRDSLKGVSLETVLPANSTNLIAHLAFNDILITPLDNEIVGLSSVSEVTIKTILGTESPMKVLYVVLNVSLMNGEEILGYLNYESPVRNGSNPTFELNILGNVTLVQGGDKWADFTSQYVAKDSVGLSLRGTMGATVEVAVGQMTLSGLTVDSTVTLTGMKGLSNTTVQHLDMPRNTEHGIEMIISVVMENPSVATMTMGDIYFDAYYEDVIIGNMMSQNVTIIPGPNNITMTGELRPKSAEEANPKIEKFFNRYIAGLSTVVTVHGKPNPNNKREDSKKIPKWVETVIQSLKVSTAVEGPKNMKLIRGLTLHGLSMALPGQLGSVVDDGMIPVGSDVEAVFVSPFTFPLSVTEVQVRIDMIYNETIVATMDKYTDRIPAWSNQTAQQLFFNMTGATLRVVDREKFAAVTAGLLLEPYMNLTMAGVSIAQVSTKLGLFTLNNVSFSSPVGLTGFNSFPEGTITMKGNNQNITSGHRWGLYMNTVIQMYNPTIVSLNLTGMVMDIYFENVLMGNVTMSNLSLVPGDNLLSGSVTYQSPDRDLYGKVERKFFSRYTQGNSSVIQLKGNSNNVPLLVGGLLRLVTQTKFTGQPTALIKTVQLIPRLGILNPLDPTVKTAITVINPFPTIYTISTMTNFQVYFAKDWSYMGHLDDVYNDNPVPVLPEDNGGPDGRTLNQINFHLTINVYADWEALRGKPSKAVGELQFSLGDFGPVTIDYQTDFKISF